MRAALRILAHEHLALRAVGRVLAMEAELLRRGDTADADLLGLIVEYLEAFPNRIHHPKEESELFRRMRERDPAGCAAILDQLLADHEKESVHIGALAEAVRAYAVGRDTGHLADLAARYAHFLDQHIDLEDREAFPKAETVLSEADWRAVDAAFLANDDPLASGRDTDGRFAALHRRIVSLGAPPPGL